MVRIGVVGFGKIARDQHLPAIAGNPDFELVAIADPAADLAALPVPGFRSQDEMLAARPDLDAVAICTPPLARTAVTLAALAAGKHVLIEKPPTATVNELLLLRDAAAASGCVLFTAWHSQHNDAVEAARERLRGAVIERVEIVWKEDVHKWHPGQQWIWEPGGFGVLDPGINAFSILTRILPERAFVRAAELTMPRDAETPVTARIELGIGRHGGTGIVELDWAWKGGDLREIRVTPRGAPPLVLEKSGERLVMGGDVVVEGKRAEYAGIYRMFAGLVQDGTSSVDVDPLILVCDVIALGRRVAGEAIRAA